MYMIHLTNQNNNKFIILIYKMYRHKYIKYKNKYLEQCKLENQAKMVGGVKYINSIYCQKDGNVVQCDKDYKMGESKVCEEGTIDNRDEVVFYQSDNVLGEGVKQLKINEDFEADKNVKYPICKGIDIVQQVLPPVLKKGIPSYLGWTIKHNYRDGAAEKNIDNMTSIIISKIINGQERRIVIKNNDDSDDIFHQNVDVLVNVEDAELSGKIDDELNKNFYKILNTYNEIYAKIMEKYAETYKRYGIAEPQSADCVITTFENKHNQKYVIHSVVPNCDEEHYKLTESYYNVLRLARDAISGGEYAIRDIDTYALKIIQLPPETGSLSIAFPVIGGKTGQCFSESDGKKSAIYSILGIISFFEDGGGNSSINNVIITSKNVGYENLFSYFNQITIEDISGDNLYSNNLSQYVQRFFSNINIRNAYNYNTGIKFD